MADVKLWRYYDLIKFLTLVNGEIYFARADKLKDPYEGAIPKQNFLGYTERANDSTSATDKENIRKEFLKKFDERKKKAAFSCWHINENESAAMWEAYSRAGQGIAVRTTLDKLERVRKPQGYEMEMFRVDYIDFDSEYGEQYIRNELLPFKNKRKEFEYEREFRIMLYQINPLSQPGGGARGTGVVARGPGVRATGTGVVVRGPGVRARGTGIVVRGPVVQARGTGVVVRGDRGTGGVTMCRYPKCYIPRPTVTFQSRFNDLPPEGLKINVNAAELIDEIIASPDMEPYEVDEIQKILDLINKGKGTGFTIRRSRLYENLQY